MKRLWQKLKGSDEKDAGPTPSSLASAPSVTHHGPTTSISALDSSAGLMAVGSNDTAEPDQDEDIEVELNRFELKRMKLQQDQQQQQLESSSTSLTAPTPSPISTTSSSLTLLQSLEALMKEELSQSTNSDVTTVSGSESTTSNLPSTWLRLLLIRVRRSLMNRVSLGSMNLLAELIATYRDQLISCTTISSTNQSRATTAASSTTPSNQFNDTESFAIQSVVLDLFRLLQPYTSNTHALHCYFNLFEAPRLNATLVSTLRSMTNASSNPALPFVLFEPPTIASGSFLNIGCLSNSRWNSAHQYTSMAWLRMDFKQPKPSPTPKLPATAIHPELSEFTHPPFYILLLESDDTKSLISLSYAPSTNTFILRTGSKNSVTFTPAQPLPLGRWHHVTLTHSKALLGGSNATLFVNGQLVSIQKANYPNKPSSTSNVSVKVGLLPLNSREPSSLPHPPPTSALQWRLASTAFLDDSTNEASARMLYDLGPRIAGVAAAATLLSAKCTITDAALHGYLPINALNEAFDDVAAVVARTMIAQQRASVSGTPDGLERRASITPSPSLAASPTSTATAHLDDLDEDAFLPGSANLRFSPQEVASMLPTSFLPYEKLIYFFSAKNSVDKETHEFHYLHSHEIQRDPKGSSSNSLKSSPSISPSGSPQSNSTPASILVNGGLLGSKDGSSDAFLIGRCHLIRPIPLADSIRSIGGVARILQLLSKICLGHINIDQQSLALREGLLLLTGLLRRNPKNLHDMNQQKGYTLLAHLMQRLGENCTNLISGLPSVIFKSISNSNTSSPEKTTLSKTSSKKNATLSSPAAVVTSTHTASANSILMDTSLVEIMFAFVGLNEKGNNGSISSPTAMKTLILNFHIWEHFDLTVQTYLFEGLVNCIAMNPSREENMNSLRQIHLVPWLLTLVADQKLPPTILVHAVSLLREFLMDPVVTVQTTTPTTTPSDEELQLVSNFALTSCMLHSQREIHHQHQLQQQPPPKSPGVTASAAAAAARNVLHPSVRRFTITPNDARILSSGPSVNVAAGLSALGVAAGYLPVGSEISDAFDKELNSYRLGSFLSPQVRRTFLELLLDVLSKLHAHSSSNGVVDVKAIDTFFKYVDFGWIFSVLYTVDQAISHRVKRKQQEQQHKPMTSDGDDSKNKSSPSDEDDEEIICDRACALLAVKILLIFLSHSHLYKRFQSIHGFTSLGQLLLPFAHMTEMYSILLCMMLGKGVYDIPTIPTSKSLPNQSPSSSTEDWWSQLMPTTSPTHRTSISGFISPPSQSNTIAPLIPLPEALPVLMTLLEEAFQLLAEENKMKLAQSLNPTPAAAIVSEPSGGSSVFKPTNTVPKRPSFINVPGLSAAASGSAAAIPRHGSISIQPMLAAAMATATASISPALAVSSPKEGSFAGGLKDSSSNEEIHRPRRSHSRQGSMTSSSNTNNNSPNTNFHLDRSYWSQPSSRSARTSSTASSRRKGYRIGVRNEVRSTTPMPNMMVLQQVIHFLTHLHSTSEEFRQMAAKEPFIKSLALVTYTSAPLQPDLSQVAPSQPMMLPNYSSGGSCIDLNTFTTFLPSQLQFEDIITSLGSRIVTPIFQCWHPQPNHQSSHPHTTRQNSATLSGSKTLFQSRQSGSLSLPMTSAGVSTQTRSQSISVIRPLTPATDNSSAAATTAIVSLNSIESNRSQSANSSRPETPSSSVPTPLTTITPLATVTMNEYEWNSIQRVQEEDVDIPAPLPPSLLSITNTTTANGNNVLNQVNPSKLEVFHHPLSIALFHLLRQIASHVLTTNPKGHQILDEMLDQAPNYDLSPIQPQQSNSQKEKSSTPELPTNQSLSLNSASSLSNITALRNRYQNILLSSLHYRLIHTVSASEFFSNVKLMGNLVLHSKSILARLHSGCFLGSGLWLELVVGLLETVEGRAIMDIECTDPNSPAGSSAPQVRRRTSISSAPPSVSAFNISSFNFSNPVTKPLLESCNAVILHLYQYHITQLGTMLAPMTPSSSPPLPNTAINPAVTVGSLTSSSSIGSLAGLSTSLGAAGMIGANGSTSGSSAPSPILATLSPATPSLNQLFSLNELSRLNQFLLTHSRLLLGEYQHDHVFLASLSYQLFQLITHQPSSPISNDLTQTATHTALLQSLTLSSMRLWSCLLRQKLGYMSELLRLSQNQLVHVGTGLITIETNPTVIANLPGHHHHSSSNSFILAATAAHMLPTAASLNGGLPLSPPRSPGTLIDLLDGGFDQLIGIAPQIDSSNTPPSDSVPSDEFHEFLAWRATHGAKIAIVFSNTSGKIFSHWLATNSMLIKTAVNQTVQSLLTELTKHSGSLIAVSNRLPQLEFALLNKLQHTCSEELQRNLRKQQRERVDQTRNDRQFFEQQEKKWLRMTMMYSTVDYSRIGLEQGPDEILPTKLIDDKSTSNVVPFEEFPLSSSCVLRQPWRLDTIEGPSRIRKRLDELRIQSKDELTFSYPYRPFENEKEKTNSIATASTQLVPQVTEALEQDGVDEETAARLHRAATAPPEMVTPVAATPTGGEATPQPTVQINVSADEPTVLEQAPVIWNRAQTTTESSTTSSSTESVPAHRSTRSDVTAALHSTPLRPRVGMGLVAPSPHPQSMLGRLAMSDAKKRVRQIAGAAFTPRVSRSGIMYTGLTSPPNSQARSLFNVTSPSSQNALSPPSHGSSIASLHSLTPPLTNEGSGLKRLLMRHHSSPPEASSSPLMSAGIVLLSPMAPSPRPHSHDPLSANSATAASSASPLGEFNWNDDTISVKPVTANDDKSLSSSIELQVNSPVSDGGGLDNDLDEGDVENLDLVPTPEDEWTHPLDTQLWWMEEERLSVLLADEVIKYHFNCLRIDGLDEIRGILLLCNHTMFLIDNYEISPDGTINPVLSETELDRLEIEQQNLAGDSDAALHALTAPMEHHSEKFYYADLIDLQKRRYLLREAAIELFLQNGRSALVVLNVAQRDTIYTSILNASPLVANQQNALSKILAAGASAVSSVGASSSGSGSSSASVSALHASVPTSKQHSSEFTSSLRTLLHPLTKLWQNGSLSNLDYLMSLNAISGRTYNDLTQYPIFPWILGDYESEYLNFSNFASFRDLSKPMGALSEQRAQAFRQRYRDSEAMSIGNEMMNGNGNNDGQESNGNVTRSPPKFHYGSHYSSAASVLYYMIRLEPFTQTLIKFQSGRFDRPDRLFHSIKSSWLSASEISTTDVKELIPEFFFLSEFLKNGNKLNLGTRQDDDAINDVLLPRWAHGSSREFIRVHRQALESEYVSAHLHLWIDLIFGTKQQGEAAVHALNVFYYLTYAGGVDIDSISDPILRRATIEQIRSFGQTPLSLFAKPHPPKHLMPEVGALYCKAHLLRPSTSIHFPHSIGLMWSDPQNERFFLMRQNHILVPVEGVSSVVGFASCSSALKKTKRGLKAGFLSWGFTDGTLRAGEAQAVNLLNTSSSSSAGAERAANMAHASSMAKQTRVYLNMHDGVIRVAALPEIDVGMLVTGGADSNVQVWKRMDQPIDSDYTLLSTLHGHRGPITSIAVSKAFSLIASASLDTTVILWDLFGFTPIRQIRVLPPGSRIQSVTINNSSGYICIASNLPTMVTVCDINGALLSQYPPPNNEPAFPASPSWTSPAATTPVVPPALTVAVTPTSPETAHTNPALDPISSLHMVDTVGYQMPQSSILFLTGHTTGSIRVWNMNYCTAYQIATPRGYHSPPNRTSSDSSLLRKLNTNTPSSKNSAPIGGPSPIASTGGTPRMTPTSVGGTASKRVVQPTYLSTMTEEGEDGNHDDSIFPPDSYSNVDEDPSKPPESEVELETNDVWDVEDEEEAIEREQRDQQLAANLTNSNTTFQPIMRKTRSTPIRHTSSMTLAASMPTSTGLLTQSSSTTASNQQPSASPLSVDPDLDATQSAVPSQPETNETGGRSWRLLVVSELIGHVAPITSLFVPSDRNSIWSGDAQGNVIHWCYSDAPGSAARSASSASPMPFTSNPFGSFRDVPTVASSVACNCKQSQQHKSSNIPYNCRLCSNCTIWVCSYCRLDHLRREHPYGQQKSGRHVTNSISISRPTTPSSKIDTHAQGGASSL